MMTDRALMNAIEYTRTKHHVTVQRLCDDIGISKKEYEYNVQGVRRMRPAVVLAIIKYFGVEEF